MSRTQPLTRLRQRAWAAYLHPLALTALALLLINDHILKSAPWAPRWLTGKLSDVAGLFFFPRLLTLAFACLTLPPHLHHPFDPATRHRRHHLISCVLTGIGFTALQLSPAFVDLTQTLLAPLWTPLTSRPVLVTMDPTDLIALPMLALSDGLDRRAQTRS